MTTDKRPAGRARLALYLQFLVVGGRVVASIERRRDRAIDAGGRRLRAERALAERAAGALRLGIATIDVDTRGEAPAVLRVSAMPALGMFERITGARVAEEVIGLIEARVRSWVRREEPPTVEADETDGEATAGER